jgi:hypothetical protein
MFAAWQQSLAYSVPLKDALILFSIILVVVAAVVVMRQKQMRKGRRR